MHVFDMYVPINYEKKCLIWFRRKCAILLSPGVFMHLKSSLMLTLYLYLHYYLHKKAKPFSFSSSFSLLYFSFNYSLLLCHGQVLRLSDHDDDDDATGSKYLFY